MTAVIRKTCHRYNTPSNAHFLTFSCFRRQPFLSRDRSREWFLDALGGARERHRFDLWAWVIMPEHVHLVIRPREEKYSISAILTAIKKPVTNAVLRHVRQYAPEFAERMRDQQPNGTHAYRFWQRGGGYDTNLWSSKPLWDKIRYIHMNPVRRGLVTRAEDWPWSSLRDFLDLRPVLPVPLDRHSIPPQW